jgi:hypothetical protein
MILNLLLQDSKGVVDRGAVKGHTHTQGGRDGTLNVADFQEHASRLGPYGSWPFMDRRHLPDRRLSKTNLFSVQLLRGRRAVGRRKGETRNLYVDRFQTGEVALVVVILALNIVDAYLTLNYLAKGGSEANPVARFFLEQGTHWFIFSKAFVVALCLVFLLVHKNFRYVRQGIHVLLYAYLGLLLYHIYLQLLVPPRALM